ncbi:hypothetical protein THASP1DRAFT_22134 [Thamnocephalis sphaerospora]|uniref:PHD-type domain-containing protein n=1 Tax=Thamnocephalis sphaerospora TaxID=78915 RepID=A0A4P9XV43_9FUNG|nr:hypothetical protein THASP1DRAFT_22134 [Thamnocephalis sphaerospora]|eukprot:RKP10125.1 hypothetical protein THASP1DRAFT_22134 [Thamnocephalis sphaerospora]
MCATVPSTLSADRLWLRADSGATARWQANVQERLLARLDRHASAAVKRCVPLFLSRAASQSRLLAGRMKHSEPAQAEATRRPSIRSARKKRSKRRSVDAAEDGGDIGSGVTLSAGPVTIRCESCLAEAVETFDPAQQFRIIESLVSPKVLYKRAKFLDDGYGSVEANVISSGTQRSQRKSAKKRRGAVTSSPAQNSVPDPVDGSLEIEFFKDEMADEDGDQWLLYCDQCRMVIRQFRYYCTYCEVPAEDRNYKSFELCISCFANFFPWYHEHPRSSFAEQCVLDEATITSVSTTGELALRYEEDQVDRSFDLSEHELDPTKTLDEFSAAGCHDVISVDGEDAASRSLVDLSNGYAFLERWAQRRRCALCNDDETGGELGGFVGPYPFLMPDYHQTVKRAAEHAVLRRGALRRQRRSRQLLLLGGTPIENGCTRAITTADSGSNECALIAASADSVEAAPLLDATVYVATDGRWYNVAAAVRRGKKLRCIVCQERGATIGCFESKCRRSFHIACTGKPLENFRRGIVFWCPQHEARNSRHDAYVDIYSCDSCRETLVDTWFSCTECEDFFRTYDLCLKCFEVEDAEWTHSHDPSMFVRKTKEALTLEAGTGANAVAKRPAKKFFHGVLVCERCFASSSAPTNPTRTKTETGELMPLPPPFGNGEDAALAPTLPAGAGDYVGNVDDYMHNPYLTRRCYTDGRFEETRSNAQYLDSYGPEEHQMYSLPYDSTYYDIPGRAPRYYHGTWLPHTVRRALLRYTRKNDRILSNFLGRGTDAIESFLLHRRCIGVDINPRNCSFAIPPEFGITGEMRPVILKSDARYLSGQHFSDESFDHVLSHPPYKDCVEYSAGLQGDLSRLANSQDFYREMGKVARTAWRLLKMGGRCTIGIGDNREFCFYIPVGFDLLRTYLDNGYMLEELVVKRQRYCSAFGLGTFLCVQYDFLCFTHEFIMTVERFGKDDTNWLEIRLHPELPARLSDDYEDQRKRQIIENNQMLMTLGLITDLGDDANDVPHLEKLLYDATPMADANVPLTVVVVPHLEDTDPEHPLLPTNEHLAAYRKQIVQIARRTYDALCVSGFFIVGVKDVRISRPDIGALKGLALLKSAAADSDPDRTESDENIDVEMTGDSPSSQFASSYATPEQTPTVEDHVQLLYPMGMLLLEDMNREFSDERLKLKELVVTVPNGYARDPHNWDHSYQECHIDDLAPDSSQRYLPIVHAYYLIFMKLA